MQCIFLEHEFWSRICGEKNKLLQEESTRFGYINWEPALRCELISELHIKWSEVYPVNRHSFKTEQRTICQTIPSPDFHNIRQTWREQQPPASETWLQQNDCDPTSNINGERELNVPKGRSSLLGTFMVGFLMQAKRCSDRCLWFKGCLNLQK